MCILDTVILVELYYSLPQLCKGREVPYTSLCPALASSSSCISVFSLAHFPHFLPSVYLLCLISQDFAFFSSSLIFVLSISPPYNLSQAPYTLFLFVFLFSKAKQTLTTRSMPSPHMETCNIYLVLSLHVLSCTHCIKNTRTRTLTQDCLEFKAILDCKSLTFSKTNTTAEKALRRYICQGASLRCN